MSGTGTWIKGNFTAYICFTGRAVVVFTACAAQQRSKPLHKDVLIPWELHLLIHLTEVRLLIRMRWSFLSLFYS